jgi:hypothetical protein
MTYNVGGVDRAVRILLGIGLARILRWWCCKGWRAGLLTSQNYRKRPYYPRLDHLSLNLFVPSSQGA